MTNIPAKRQPPTRHDGPAHSSPYPVSRLAPGFGLVDLAQELEQADAMIGSRLGGQLQVIAEQVRSLQAQARRILEEAREDQRLHRARCNFKRIPGHVYHLYEGPAGIPEFSMLSPADWNGRPPKPYLGAYRLELDMSWSPAGESDHRDESRQLVQRLLAASD
ncbi:MAG: DUF2452 domain-containing protein [Chromatiaceae bacterium]|jgi:hypothetical protein